MDALEHSANLVHMWVWYSVGTDESVVAKVDVRSVKTVEITAISINLNTVFAFPAGRLVNKVPDKSTLKIGVFTEQIPVFFEAAFRVAHGVSVFALNHRFLYIGAFAVFLYIFIADIHRAIYVGMVCIAATLILHGAAGVFSLYPVVGIHKVLTVTAFVAE